MQPGQWDVAVASVKKVFKLVAKAGIDLQMIDLGGGFPARYNAPIEAIGAYGNAIMNAMTKHFGNDLPRMIVEPGRYMVGDAGVLEAEVVLISTKSYGEDRRWVYLDIGRFGGLAEVEGEGIRYRIRPVREMGKDEGPVVLAGPTCIPPTSSMTRRTTRCRAISRSATVCASSRPAPTRPPTRRSTSTAGAAEGLLHLTRRSVRRGNAARV